MTVRAVRSSRVLGGAIVVASALVLTACGGTTEVSSSTTPAETSAPATTAAPPTSPPPPTTPPTTAPPTATPPTTAPTATTAPPATAPPTTVPPATAPPTTDPPESPATAFVAADEQLREVDVATGVTVRVLDEFFSGEGVFRGGLRLSPDRSVIWFSEGYEDGWYGCESSVGSFGRVDTTTGEIEILGIGSSPEPSADGNLVAYVTSSLCLPDPEAPEFWVLTPGDRVVVRNLATDEEREFVTDTPPDSYDAPSAVISAVLSPGGSMLVLLGDGRLFNVDIDGSGVIQDHPVALDEVVGEPIAATADALITLELGEEGSSDLYSADPVTGAPTLLASAGAYMAAGVGAEGQLVVSSFEPISVAPGALVTVVALDDDPFVYDIDW